MLEPLQLVGRGLRGEGVEALVHLDRVELADLLRERGEHPVAVSADAFQVYEGLDVLAAKPSADQLDRLEHRLMSFVPIDRDFSVAEFAERAHREIDALLDEGATPDRGRRHRASTCAPR